MTRSLSFFSKSAVFTFDFSQLCERSSRFINASRGANAW